MTMLNERGKFSRLPLEVNNGSLLQSMAMPKENFLPANNSILLLELIRMY